MNPNTGEITRLAPGEERAGFERLPSVLQQIARQKIQRALTAEVASTREQKPTAKVNLRSTSPLAKWAKEKRKAKIAAASRRRNRK